MRRRTAASARPPPLFCDRHLCDNASPPPPHPTPEPPTPTAAPPGSFSARGRPKNPPPPKDKKDGGADPAKPNFGAQHHRKPRLHKRDQHPQPVGVVEVKIPPHP